MIIAAPEVGIVKLTTQGGSVWKYIGAVGAIGFGAFEVYSGIGATHGAKNIVSGTCVIIGGIYTLIS